ncbi:MAG: hypothetical protein ACE5FH_05045 [Candidatus Zixiibacteriota bacterium]
MSEETKKTEETQQPEGEKATGKGGMMKYIIFGGAGLALMAVVIAATVFLMGGSSHDSAEEAGESAEVAQAGDEDSDHNNPHAESSEHALDGEDELAFDENDPSVMEAIRENLAILDYEPEDAEVEIDEPGMSVEDSIEATNWLNQEKERLTQWESELDGRKKKLDRLDSEVSKKLVRLDQAESSRIANLARLYDGMDPRSVARLMANLDDETVVSILPRMKNKNASSVLALFPAKRAARLSKQMITIAEK